MKTVMIFMLFWMFHITSTMESQAYSTFHLDMANQSVDDKYSGCTDQMAKKVTNTYFLREMGNHVTNFSTAWKQANATAQKKFEKRQDEDLTKDDIQAIVVYSNGNPDVYSPFNKAVSNGKPDYTTPSFPYHALHFWLTSAIQILNPNKQCSTTYRRSKQIYTGEINQEFRFGSFASSSKKTYLYHFGNKTCFHINTCFGAYLKDYPILGDHEQEVLIPPYEKFKIINITAQKYEDLEECETIFVVKSTGDLSNLNCKAACAMK